MRPFSLNSVQVQSGAQGGGGGEPAGGAGEEGAGSAAPPTHPLPGGGGQGGPQGPRLYTAPYTHSSGEL